MAGGRGAAGCGISRQQFRARARLRVLACGLAVGARATAFPVVGSRPANATAAECASRGSVDVRRATARGQPAQSRLAPGIATIPGQPGRHRASDERGRVRQAREQAATASRAARCRPVPPASPAPCPCATCAGAPFEEPRWWCVVTMQRAGTAARRAAGHGAAAQELAQVLFGV